MKLGEALVQEGAVALEDVVRVAAAQARSPMRLGSLLVAAGLVDADTVTRALARQHGVTPACARHLAAIDARTLALVPPDVAAACAAVPLGLVDREGPTLVVAMRDPGDEDARARLEEASGLRVTPAVTAESTLADALLRHYRRELPPGRELGAPPPTEAEAAARAAPGGAVAEPPEGELALAPVEPPVASAVPPVAAVPPAKVHRPHPLSTPAGKLVATVVGIIAAIVTVKHLRGGPTTADAAGIYVAEAVGARIDFPRGWRHVTSEEYARTQGAIHVTGTLFYRGGDVEDPEHGLMIAIADLRGKLPPTLSDAQFDQALVEMQRGMRGYAQGETSLEALSCERTYVRGERTGECPGTAVHKDERRDMIMYVWIDDERMLLAAFIARDELAEDEYIEIIQSVTLLE